MSHEKRRVISWTTEEGNDKQRERPATLQWDGAAPPYKNENDYRHGRSPMRIS
jgi:hypothetical protein